jgi:hypothetical protein
MISNKKNTFYYPIDWNSKRNRHFAVFLTISARDLLHNRFIDYLREKHANELKNEIEIGSEFDFFIDFGNVKSAQVTIQGKSYTYKKWRKQKLFFKKRQPFMNKKRSV